ncbi:P-loop containing nucleoside triphosphate hydrolase protein [Aulographum hederae CBS 113979]|uniref:P-loop containing nucleoside triphosphate hydrolase protein n=1 Tax=Aulographum hederae CBS 113979 TaxID=1176131 RepID=A0A6G1HAH5_9PEZI|nr:P-loop containing nucleoside triphosphate hydrolase protein [Aulographum hederae CBS 113979]
MENLSLGEMLAVLQDGETVHHIVEFEGSLTETDESVNTQRGSGRRQILRNGLPPPIGPPGDDSPDSDEEVVEDDEEDGAEEDGKAEGEEEIEPGMKTGMKKLYAGKEDKRGRYKWQSKPPNDIGKAVENKKTARWALVVRYIKVYNDPRKVLSIHSIVIQSPLLKKLLGRVLKGYPGITVSLQRLEFAGRLEPLIHRWEGLKDAVEKLDTTTDEGRQTKEHAQILLDTLMEEFKEIIEDSADLKAKGVMTYDKMWTLYEPGDIAFAREDGQELAFKIQSTNYGQDANKNPCFWVRGVCVDWDGSRFGTSVKQAPVFAFEGTRRIIHLGTFPIDFHPKVEEVKENLIQRGNKLESLTSEAHYTGYKGMAWYMDPNTNQREKQQVDSRIVLDASLFNRFTPMCPIFVNPFKDHQKLKNKALANGKDPVDEEDSDSDDDDGLWGANASGNIDDNYYEVMDSEQKPPKAPLTKEQKLITTPLVRGFALKSKQWLNFFVTAIRDIEYNSGAFDRLVLPHNTKELILAFTETQNKTKESFDDVIAGKGKGIILLLCGPPGTGKTLTAESIAEEMRVPLYMMSAGDLGLDSRHIESKLTNILEIVSKWKAILLIDEADVFLEQRSLHELERNKLVTIFLRILEYFQGIMFLTTNRVETFDQAFQSRIHISIQYPELSTDSRRTVWANFLSGLEKDVGMKNSISERQLDSLARMNMNGRQIKNILKTSLLLARKKEESLSHGHVLQVLDVTQHLHNATQEKEHTRSAIFS